MKKNILCFMAVVLSLFVDPCQLRGESKPNLITATSTKPSESLEAKVLIDRLKEIKSLDLSKLSIIEKQQLRKEVKSIRSELKRQGGGVYLSVGAIIIIILLLILIF